MNQKQVITGLRSLADDPSTGLQHKHVDLVEKKLNQPVLERAAAGVAVPNEVRKALRFILIIALVVNVFVWFDIVKGLI